MSLISRHRDSFAKGLGFMVALGITLGSVLNPGFMQTAHSQSAATVSLELNAVDVKDVFKILATEGDLNIITAPDVKGKVTLYIQDVDVWEAFDMVVASNRLAYEVKGDLISVMTEQDYMNRYGVSFVQKEEVVVIPLKNVKAAEIMPVVTSMKSKIGTISSYDISNAIIVMDTPQAIERIKDIVERIDVRRESKSYILNYVKAQEIKPVIESHLTDKVGRIVNIEGSSRIVVTDTPEVLQVVDRLIETFDVREPGVLIEAKIVEIALEDEYALGIDWEYVLEGVGGIVNANFDAISGNVATSGSTVTGAALQLTGLAHDDALSITIEALEKIGKTNVISSPRIVVANHEDAKVLVGTNRPFVTTTTTVPESGSSITAEKVEYVEVGVSLKVTPEISDDGYVRLKVQPEISSADSTLTTSSSNLIPIKETSTVETTLMVKDRSSVILAGLIQDRDIISESRIPLLADLPLVGGLFRSTNTGSSSAPEKKELVIFLTCTILDGNESFAPDDNIVYRKGFTQDDVLTKKYNSRRSASTP